MSPYRGSDEELEREIATIEGLVRVRLGRANRDLRELESSLRDLRRELRRRRSSLPVPEGETVPDSASA